MSNSNSGEIKAILSSPTKARKQPAVKKSTEHLEVPSKAQLTIVSQSSIKNLPNELKEITSNMEKESSLNPDPDSHGLKS